MLVTSEIQNAGFFLLLTLYNDIFPSLDSIQKGKVKKYRRRHKFFGFPSYKVQRSQHYGKIAKEPTHAIEKP